MIVDDEPQNIEILGNILSGQAVLKVATNGQKAVEMVHSESIDLILLDIEMPLLNGYEVCRQIKMIQKFAAIPIIFVTGKDKEGDEIKGFDIGAVDYITKPFSPALVRARVKAHLALRKAQADLEQHNETLKSYLKLLEDIERIGRHDLKGSLSPILGFSELLLMDPTITREQREALSTIRSSGLRLLNMINQSLDLFRIEAGTYHLTPQPVDLIKVFRNIAREQESLWRNKNSPLELHANHGSNEAPEHFMVSGEEGLLYTMFTNLLKNAWEATPNESPVNVSMHFCPWAEIRIQNSGVVPSEIRSTFFCKFVTLGKKGGTGLGAYSAKLMAKALFGTISLEIIDEKSTVIAVNLPSYEGQLPGKTISPPRQSLASPSLFFE